MKTILLAGLLLIGAAGCATHHHHHHGQPERHHRGYNRHPGYAHNVPVYPVHPRNRHTH